jgi:hypothetical protein
MGIQEALFGFGTLILLALLTYGGSSPGGAAASPRPTPSRVASWKRRRRRLSGAEAEIT